MEKIAIGDRVKIDIEGFNCTFWGTVTRVGTDHVSVRKVGKPSPLSGDIDLKHVVEVVKGDLKC